MLRRRRLHRLRPERRGGVLPLPNPALDAGKGRSTCGHQPTNGANWPEARTGLVWEWRLRVLTVFFRAVCVSPAGACDREATRCRTEAINGNNQSTKTPRFDRDAVNNPQTGLNVRPHPAADDRR